jgi:hypothetical protein
MLALVVGISSALAMMVVMAVIVIIVAGLRVLS